jgi:hypothetical protein
MSTDALETSGLDHDTLVLVWLPALVALDAPTESYLMTLGARLTAASTRPALSIATRAQADGRFVIENDSVVGPGRIGDTPTRKSKSVRAATCQPIPGLAADMFALSDPSRTRCADFNPSGR